MQPPEEGEEMAGRTPSLWAFQGPQTPETAHLSESGETATLKVCSVGEKLTAHVPGSNGRHFRSPGALWRVEGVPCLRTGPPHSHFEPLIHEKTPPVDSRNKKQRTQGILACSASKGPKFPGVKLPFAPSLA